MEHAKSVSRSGVIPEPTVIVRMEENVRHDRFRLEPGAVLPFVIALGDVSNA